MKRIFSATTFQAVTRLAGMAAFALVILGHRWAA